MPLAERLHRNATAAAAQQDHVGRRLAFRHPLRVDRMRRQYPLDLSRQLVHHRCCVCRLGRAIQGLGHLLEYQVGQWGAALISDGCLADADDWGAARTKALPPPTRLPARRSPALVCAGQRPRCNSPCQCAQRACSGRPSLSGSVPLMRSVRPAPRTTTPQRCSVAYLTLTACCSAGGTSRQATESHMRKQTWGRHLLQRHCTRSLARYSTRIRPTVHPFPCPPTPHPPAGTWAGAGRPARRRAAGLAPQNAGLHGGAPRCQMPVRQKGQIRALQVSESVAEAAGPTRRPAAAAHPRTGSSVAKLHLKAMSPGAMSRPVGQRWMCNQLLSLGTLLLPAGRCRPCDCCQMQPS